MLPIGYDSAVHLPNVIEGQFAFTTETSGNPDSVWGRGSVGAIVRQATGQYYCTMPGTYKDVVARANVHDGTSSKDYKARVYDAGNQDASGEGYRLLIVYIHDGATLSDLGGDVEIHVFWRGHAGGDDLQLVG